MTQALEAYEGIVGTPVIRQLRMLGEKLKGIQVTHVNSTSEGGGVAEILFWMIPLMRELGIDAHWKVIRGSDDFFPVTKSIHNGLQGTHTFISHKDWETYEKVNAENFQDLKDILQESDVVIIHDPQPAFLLKLCEKRRGKWIWRAHIDISRPSRRIWVQFRSYVEGYDSSIFSMFQFAQPLPHPQYIITPSIDPLSPKNIDLNESELESVRQQFKLDSGRPLLVQISRYDRFKDPVGVIEAYRMVRKILPVQLVLAGGGAADDPEGKRVFDEVMHAANNDPDIHVLLLPSDAHKTINALQRLADIIIQKSIKEGFGLTVTEGLWKGKPVIGGDVGGIQLQVINHHTGFLINTPEGAAHRIRFLLHHRNIMQQMGNTAREFVRGNFLLTRNIREYLTLILSLYRGETKGRIEV
ncbi:MAG TPA: glycosyltransferase [Syntrophales bacterium]|nr:glycosyltransferase [Syntrophales bacterium]